MQVFKMNDTTLQTSIGLRIQHVLATLAVSGKDKSGQCSDIFRFAHA